MKEIDLLGNNATQKDKTMYPVLELVLEMYERGIKFLPIDLYKSKATKFTIEEEGIRPPLNSIAGLGTVAALGIEKAREEGKFMSIDDMKKQLKIRSIGVIVTRALEKIGVRQNGCQKGVRLFRHNLASSLLESGIATNVISEILGHTSPLSLNPYIDADLVHLRECGLDISSFPVRKEVFI